MGLTIQVKRLAFHKWKYVLSYALYRHNTLSAVQKQGEDPFVHNCISHWSWRDSNSFVLCWTVPVLEKQKVVNQYPISQEKKGFI